ncbi:ead/Ea22-like family protein [Tatumella ptyseos]|nr:ead/Ea22-like family protein [Tatumella ptyseos]SQK75782.1 Uncharacterised protein [Tatumella ptyseos]
MTDISELVQRIKAAAKKATPGKWMWWTSNSFLRLSSDATAKDGGVIDSYRMEDGHTSLQVSKSDQDFIALCFPENITVIIDALEKAQARIAELEARTVNTPGTKCIGWLREEIKKHDEKWKASLSAAGIKLESE